MKKIYLISFLSLSICCTATAQTKLIAHKSHSGSLANFKTALENNLFDISDSNFGVAPVEIIENAVLDSLIYVDDSTAIMVTSHFCNLRNGRDTSIWKAGRTVVYFHPLFKNNHALDSIKSVLDEKYFFKKPSDSIVFVGYDNFKTPTLVPALPNKKELRKAKKVQKKLDKQEKKRLKKLQKQLKLQNEEKPVIRPAVFIPTIGEDPKDPPAPPGYLKIFLVSGLIVLSLMIGYFSSLSKVSPVLLRNSN